MGEEDIFEPFKEWGQGKEEPIFEFANVPKRIHHLSADIKLHIAQPGDKEYGHQVRVKVFRHRDDEPEAFAVKMDLDPSKIKLKEGNDYRGLLNRKQFNEVMEFLKKYRVPVFNLWFRPGADILEMRDEMDIIDAGGEVEFYGTRRDQNKNS